MERPPRSCAVLEDKRGGSRISLPSEFAANVIETDGFQRGTTLRDSNMRLRKDEGFCAKRVGYGSNTHFQTAISADGQEPGQRHAAGPARGAEFRFGPLFWNPAPQDPVAMGIQLGFLRVVRAMIQDAALLNVEDGIFRVEFADLPNHASSGRIEKHVFCTQREKIRALPHFTGIDRIDRIVPGPFTAGQRVEIFPLM